MRFSGNPRRPTQSRAAPSQWGVVDEKDEQEVVAEQGNPEAVGPFGNGRGQGRRDLYVRLQRRARYVWPGRVLFWRSNDLSAPAASEVRWGAESPPRPFPRFT